MRASWFAPMLVAFPGGVAFAQSVDLTTTSANVSPTTVELGTMVTVSGAFGGMHLGNVEYRVVISSDANLDPGDSTVQTDTVVFSNAASTPYTTTFAMPVVPAATWTVFVEVDSALAVSETNEANNALASAQALTMRGADLRVESMAGPDYGFAGGTYPIELTISNTGPVDADDFEYDYYLSDTPIIRVFSTHLAQLGPISVPAGGQVTVTDVVMLPTSTVTGYIGVILDQRGVVPESSLVNNIDRIQHEVRVLDPAPELSGALVEVPAQAAIGEQLAITRTLANGGVLDASFDYLFVLSTDPNISTADLELGRFSAMLPAGGDDYLIDLMNVPFTVVTGDYYVGMIVDPDDLLFEPNEADNVVLGPQVHVYEGAIQFTTETLPDATLGIPYEAAVYASGPLAVTFSISDGALPGGMTLTAEGLISGVPTASGSFDFTVRAHSGTAVSDRRFSIRVVETTVPLEVVPIALPTGVIGREYAAELIAVGGQPPYTWSPVGELPVGLSLGEDGRITGVPEQEGEHPIAVRVRDSIGAAASRDFILRVITPEQTLAIKSTSLPSAIIGEDYCGTSTIRFEAERGIEPYTWSAVGELPPGMTLSAAGELCGTPTRVGNFPVTVRVVDQTGLFDTALFSLEVVSETSFSISTTDLPDAEVGKAYEATLEVFRGEPPLTFTAIEGAGDLPAGLSLSSDGKITGTPSTEGVFAFVVHVVDSASRADSQPLSIAVKAGQDLKKDDSGCSCTASASDASTLGLLLMLGLLLLRRR